MTTIIEATDQLIAQLKAIAPDEFDRHEKTSIRINHPDAKWIKLVGVQEYHSTGWNRNPLGRFYITIGTFGNRKGFNHNKRNGWPAQAIVDFVREYCRREAAERAADIINSAARTSAEALRLEIGSPFVRIETVPGNTETVYFNFRRAVSKDAARELAAYLKAGGYL